MTDTNDYQGCFLCSETNPHAVEGHHLVPQRFNGTDQPENMVDLCGSCHNKIEQLYDDQFYERLGVAVDEIDNERVDYSGGRTVDAEQSLDRMVPPTSPHMRIEKLRFFRNIDSPSRKYNPAKSHWVSNPEEFYKGGPTNDTRTGKRIEQFPDNYRMHCSYCHTVFTEHEHSDLARHLRVRHGIENPYEPRDSTFTNPPEDGLLEDMY